MSSIAVQKQQAATSRASLRLEDLPEPFPEDVAVDPPLGEPTTNISFPEKLAASSAELTTLEDPFKITRGVKTQPEAETHSQTVAKLRLHSLRALRSCLVWPLRARTLHDDILPRTNPVSTVFQRLSRPTSLRRRRPRSLSKNGTRTVSSSALACPASRGRDQTDVIPGHRWTQPAGSLASSSSLANAATYCRVGAKFPASGCSIARNVIARRLARESGCRHGRLGERDGA